eukprot:2831898-Amphidinium_carterae.1
MTGRKIRWFEPAEQTKGIAGHFRLLGSVSVGRDMLIRPSLIACLLGTAISLVDVFPCSIVISVEIFVAYLLVMSFAC